MKYQQNTTISSDEKELPELFGFLGLSALSEDQKVLIRTELEQVVYKRMMVRLLHTAPNEDRERAVDAMKKGDSATALEQLIATGVDMQSLVMDEIRRIRHELYEAVHRVTSPSVLPAVLPDMSMDAADGASAPITVTV